MPIWTTITSPNDGSLYWTHYFNSDQATAQQYFYGNIENLAKLAYAMQGKAKPQLSKYTANLATSYQLAGITSNRFLRNVNVGTSIRWQSRQSIGFYGAAPEADGIVRSYDPNHPIYIGSKKYVDVIAGYNFRMFKDRIKSRLQLNISNVLEGGRLQPFAARPDGSIYGYRIVDPREYKLTWSFDL